MYLSFSLSFFLFFFQRKNNFFGVVVTSIFDECELSCFLLGVVFIKRCTLGLEFVDSKFETNICNLMQFKMLFNLRCKLKVTSYRQNFIFHETLRYFLYAS